MELVDPRVERCPDCGLTCVTFRWRFAVYLCVSCITYRAMPYFRRAS